jgi:hypothetical protein
MGDEISVGSFKVAVVFEGAHPADKTPTLVGRETAFAELTLQLPPLFCAQ